MDIKRTIAGASILGLIGFPAWLLGAGVAGADPAPAPQQCTDTANCKQNAGDQDKGEEKHNASQSPFQIPESWSREVAKNVANLPSPVEANASVPISIGLPDVVPDVGLSVPFIVNPPALNLGQPSVNPLNPLGLPPPPNPLNPLGLPPPPNPLNPLGLPPPPF